jgi:alpha-1,3-rhamnosyl/mannosyltransferase
MSERLPRLATDWEWVILRHGPDRTDRVGHTTTIWRNIPFSNFETEQQALVPFVSEIKPDLTHALWFPLPQQFGGRRIMTVMDTIAQQGHPEFISDHALSLNLGYRASCQLADHIIVPSYHTFRDMTLHYTYPPDRMTVIPLGVSDIFSSVTPAAIQAVRATYNLPAKYIYCSAHHNSVSYKNAQVVPAALKNLTAQGLNVPPLLSTGIAHPQSTNDWIQLPILSDADLAAVLAGSLMMIYPSRAEGFGLPLLEAMACGVPVISSNAASLPEVGGEAVLYFEPTNTAQLASSIRAILESDFHHTRLRELGLQRARQFRWPDTAAATIEAYQRALTAPSRAVTIDLPLVGGSAYWQGKAKRAPHDPDVLREWGKACKRENLWAEAVEIFSQMLADASTQSSTDHQRSALFHLGESRLHTGDIDGAITALEECLRLCPTHQTAPTLLEKARSHRCKRDKERSQP